MEEVAKFVANRPSLWTAILFAGDRLTCCEEGIALKDETGRIVSLVTISFKGEDLSGQPGIVGLYTIPEARNGKVGIKAGEEVVRAAVHRCIDDKGFDNIRIDVLSTYALRILNSLDSQLRDKLDIRDLSGFVGFED